MITHHVTSTNINEVYERCRKRRNDKSSVTVSFQGFMSTTHHFSQQRLEEAEPFILCALKQLPKELRRSKGCAGLPWFTARHFSKYNTTCFLEVADRLLSMAAVLDFITVLSPPANIPCDALYIIIEDIKLKRKYRMQKNERRAKWD